MVNMGIDLDKIKEILDSNPHCPKCGAEMSKYPFYDEWYEYYPCPKCDYMKMVRRVCK